MVCTATQRAGAYGDAVVLNEMFHKLGRFQAGLDLKVLGSDWKFLAFECYVFRRAKAARAVLSTRLEISKLSFTTFDAQR